MSVSTTVRCAIDSYISASSPAANYVKSQRLRVGSSGAFMGLLMFYSPAPKGAIIVSAKVYLTQQGTTFSTSTGVEAVRVTSPWAASTVDWYNAPTLATAAPIAGVTTLASGGEQTLWAIDVTQIYQAFANGTANYGLMLQQSTGSNEVDFYASESVHKPYMIIEWSLPPRTPTVLKPAGTNISIQNPVFACDYTDGAGNSAIQSMRVQVSATSNWTTPDWDSGAVAVDHPQLDSSTTSWTGLADAASTYWRACTQDGDGNWSGWSDAVQITRHVKGTLTITGPAQPAGGLDAYGTTGDYTPTFTWSLTGATQRHYRVLVYDVAANTLVVNSGLLAGTVTSWQVPAKKALKDGRNYKMVLRVYDQWVPREDCVNDPGYTVAYRYFNVTPGATATPSALSATTTGAWVDLSITLGGSAPDTFVVERNGVCIATGIVPGTLTQPSSGVYSWRDWTAPADQPLTYVVRADVNGVLSAGGPSATITPVIEGVWIGDPATGTQIQLAGTGISHSVTDEDEVFQPMGNGDVVRAISGLGALVGAADKMIIHSRPTSGFDWKSQEAAMNWVKSHPLRTYRLAWNGFNIPVYIGWVDIAPHINYVQGNPTREVSFKFWQNGELPYALSAN